MKTKKPTCFCIILLMFERMSPCHAVLINSQNSIRKIREKYRNLKPEERRKIDALLDSTLTITKVTLSIVAAPKEAYRWVRGQKAATKQINFCKEYLQDFAACLKEDALGQRSFLRGSIESKFDPAQLILCTGIIPGLNNIMDTLESTKHR